MSFHRHKFGSDSNGNYVGPLKKRHRSKGRKSLAARCLEDGTLDCDLETGEVFSLARGERRPIKTRIDEDGYVKFTLKRETDGREVRKVNNAEGRRRLSMEVFVHRLVFMKKLAVAKGEHRWRENVEDLPGDKDVHHRFGKTDNRGSSLTLEYVAINRSRSLALSEQHEELF